MSQGLQTRSNEDESSVVQRVISGDRSAFEQLMRRFNQRLYRLARATLRDETEAEDALQDAYLAAYRSIGQFRGESSLGTWLSRLVLNECLMRLRRHARRQNVIPIVGSTADTDLEMNKVTAREEDLPERVAGHAQLRELLERKLDELPESYRAVFVMRSVEDLSVEEVAACLQISEATVRTRHFRAKGLMREALARDLEAAERDLFEFLGVRCDRIVARVLERLEDAASERDE